MCTSKITISFKNTKKEQRMFEYVKSQEEISEYIKRAVEYYNKYIEICHSDTPFEEI